MSSNTAPPHPQLQLSQSGSVDDRSTARQGSEFTAHGCVPAPVIPTSALPQFRNAPRLAAGWQWWIYVVGGLTHNGLHFSLSFPCYSAIGSADMSRITHSRQDSGKSRWLKVLRILKYSVLQEVATAMPIQVIKGLPAATSSVPVEIEYAIVALGLSRRKLPRLIKDATGVTVEYPRHPFSSGSRQIAT